MEEACWCSSVAGPGQAWLSLAPGGGWPSPLRKHLRSAPCWGRGLVSCHFTFLLQTPGEPQDLGQSL